MFAERSLRKAADGTYREVKNFLPMNFRWAHSPDPERPEVFADRLSSQMGQHCNLGPIMDPQHYAFHGVALPDVPRDQTVLVLDLEVVPNTTSHLLSPGDYELHLKITASNAKPISERLAIVHTGKWHTDEAKMFADGIGPVEVN